MHFILQMHKSMLTHQLILSTSSLLQTVLHYLLPMMHYVLRSRSVLHLITNTLILLFVPLHNPNISDVLPHHLGRSDHLLSDNLPARLFLVMGSQESLLLEGSIVSILFVEQYFPNNSTLSLLLHLFMEQTTLVLTL